MCQRVTCQTCGKPTYAGCGRHIEVVLADVPPEARCHCREARATTASQSMGEREGFFAFLLRCRAFRSKS
jgi:hypothetical protein